MHIQNWSCWWPGAKAPGHQCLLCWLNNHWIMCIGPISYRYTTVKRIQYYIVKNKEEMHPVILGLIHWGWVTHKCVSKLTTIGSDNGLSPGWRQANIWTNAWILLIRTLGTKFSEISSEIHTFSFKKMHLKIVVCEMAAILPQPQCVNTP